MKETLRIYENAIANLKDEVTTLVRDINFKLMEDNPLIVHYHTLTNMVETIEVESISNDGLILGNCGTIIGLSDLTSESVAYVFEYYHDLVDALDVVNKSQYVHGIDYTLQHSVKRILNTKEALKEFDSVLKSMDLENYLTDNTDFSKALFNLRESILTNS